MIDVPATVFVVDDDPSICKAMKRLFQTMGFRVLTFGSGQAFLDYVTEDTPGCLVLDVRMPGLGGLDLQRELAGKDIIMPIVFVSGHGDVPTSVQAMKAGAVDFLPKPFRDEDLLQAVRQAIDRGHRARQERAAKSEIRERIDSLTPRERQVFSLVVTGMLNKQIGDRLGIREKTIKVHRARVMEKMMAESVADLVRMAEKAGT